MDSTEAPQAGAAGDLGSTADTPEVATQAAPDPAKVKRTRTKKSPVATEATPPASPTETPATTVWSPGFIILDN